jgi:hypothetical protein
MRTLLICLLAAAVSGLAPMLDASATRGVTVRLEATTNGWVAPTSGRRAFGASMAGALASLSLARPALAVDRGTFGSVMAGYGIVDTKFCPDGFSPIIEFVGKAVSGMEPLLVTYNSPQGWLLVRPNIDRNGEDGTVSSGDYGKGDSASVFIGRALKPGETLADRAVLDDIVYAGVTQKGASQVQGYKLGKVTLLPGKTAQPYYIFDYKYTLITGAGFEVARKGYGSITAVGTKNTQAVLAATVDARLKKTGPQLQEVASSFRAYNGITPPPPK